MWPQVCCLSGHKTDQIHTRISCRGGTKSILELQLAVRPVIDPFERFPKTKLARAIAGWTLSISLCPCRRSDPMSTRHALLWRSDKKDGS